MRGNKVNDVISEFNSRTQEVDKYFSFIKSLTDDGASLYFANKQTHKHKTIDDETLKILKANSFLLLYNLIESSFKSALKKLVDEINNSGLKYENSIPEIKKMWIEYEKSYFTKHPNNTKKLDYIYDIVDNIADQILSVPSKLQGNGISGNLDAQKIKKFAALYGISSDTLVKKPGSQLLTVKTNRNNLAHGDESFSSCGRNYSFQELNVIKKEVVTYMRFILKRINSKINAKYYSVA